MRSIPDSQAIAMIAIMSLLTFLYADFRSFCFLENPRHLLTSCTSESTSLRYHRYAGGLLLQEYFPAAGTVRTARADRRHCHRSGTLAGRKIRFFSVGGGTLFLHVSCSDNF